MAGADHRIQLGADHAKFVRTLGSFDVRLDYGNPRVGMLLLQSGACVTIRRLRQDGNGRRVAIRHGEVLDELQAGKFSPSSEHPCDASSGALDMPGQWSGEKSIS